MDATNSEEIAGVKATAEFMRLQDETASRSIPSVSLGTYKGGGASMEAALLRLMLQHSLSWAEAAC